MATHNASITCHSSLYHCSSLPLYFAKQKRSARNVHCSGIIKMNVESHQGRQIVDGVLSISLYANHLLYNDNVTFN